MDKKKLNQYKALKREQKKLEEKLDKLYERESDIPIVIGKVKGSSREFPYIETHMTVEMDEPKKSDIIYKQVKINEKRKREVDSLLIEIEKFIASIPDSNARQIYELTFLEGKKQREIAEQVGYSRSRISQIINDYLKD